MKVLFAVLFLALLSGCATNPLVHREIYKASDGQLYSIEVQPRYKMDVEKFNRLAPIAVNIKKEEIDKI